MTGVTSVYLKSPLFPDKYTAAADYVFGRAGTLEPDLSYIVPEITFLRDTTPKHGFSSGYYGKVIGGTEWPDRFRVEPAGE
ncbi:MAG: hypothetical protein AAAB20_26235 [Rhizobium sp.]|uniref:hypothetical protein n=1 Tax=Rhizobium sp. TaxID=391 RepID=UPI0030F19E22